MPTPIAKSSAFTMSRRLAAAKAKEFTIEEKFNVFGYRSREDLSLLSPTTLVYPSQNVLTDVFGYAGPRQGYNLYGQSNSNNLPILSSYDWETHVGTIRNLRTQSPSSAGNDGVLSLGYIANAGDYYNGTTFTQSQVYWIPIISNLSSAYCNFAPFWDSSQFIQHLLMVNGNQTITDWTGATATVKAVSNSAGAIQSISTTPTAGGTGYTVGDILTISGGTGATVQVNAVVNGAITGIAVSSHVGNGGTAYANSDTVSVGGVGNYGLLTVTSNSGGTITGVSITNIGNGYIVQNGVPSGNTSGSGHGAWFDITSVASGVVGTNNFNNINPPLTLLTPGTGYSAGSGNATTGGTGSGATINILSVSDQSITVNGNKTIGQLGFYNDTNNHQLLINGAKYGYISSTSNNNSFSFLGISPDPTRIPVNSVIIQAPEVTPNTGTGGLPLSTGTTFTNWTNDLIGIVGGYTYVGCKTNNTIYVSNQGSFTNYGTSLVVTVGIGAPFTLDAPPVAFYPQENAMYVDAGKDWKYQIYPTVTVNTSATTATQQWTFNVLKNSPLQAAQSQGLVGKVGDYIVFVSNEQMIRSMGRVTDVLATPQMPDIGYPIVNDINIYNFTDGHVAFNKNFVYITAPKQNIMRIYNMTNNEDKEPGSKGHYWEAPQTLPIGCMSIINGQLIGHSYGTSESYTLFNGSSDNGQEIYSVVAFPQLTQGGRHKTKSFNMEYIEGYISQNSIINAQNFYYQGNKTLSLTKQILGTDKAIINATPEGASLGKTSLGKNPIGGDAIISNPNTLPPNFQVYKTFQRTPYFKWQPIFWSRGKGQNWFILAYGSNSSTTSETETSITE